jgi:hypothetical protein
MRKNRKSFGGGGGGGGFGSSSFTGNLFDNTDIFGDVKKTGVPFSVRRPRFNPTFLPQQLAP